MNDENDSQVIPDVELEEVSGGRERFVPLPDGRYEYWFDCPCGYKELVASGSMDIQIFLEGTFKCPECGWSRDFSVHLG